MQDHKPVLEQEEAVGHAVRAMYLYAGMADVAALGGHPEYVKAIDRLWESVAGKHLYLTGGVGARGTSEAFGNPYELPNASAYTETCAVMSQCKMMPARPPYKGDPWSTVWKDRTTTAML